MSHDLRGAVVVITGASSGVGRATAIGFAEQGSDVVVAARGGEALAGVVVDCRQRGARAVAVPTDTADPAAVEHLARRAVDAFGRVDVWVNNAAVVLAAPFGDEPVEEVRRIIDTNILGYVLGSREAMKRFQAQGAGTLINVSSLLGLVPNPLVPVYVMSKFAIRGLSLSLRQLVSGNPAINVSTVLPGPIDTPAFERAANHTGRGLRAIPPAYAPERVAAAIVSCARRPRRHVRVGAAMRLVFLLHRLSPRLAEWGVAKSSAMLLLRRQAADDTAGTLFGPPEGGRVHGGWRRGRDRRRLGEAFGRALLRRGRRPPSTADQRPRG